MYNYNDLYVYHHLGLGDHIICNGLVRNICKKIKNVNLFCKPVYFESVSFMYRDLDNIKIIKGDDKTVPVILNDIPKENKIIVGFDNFHYNYNNEPFDKFFYSNVGLNFEKRWTDFYIERDHVREQKLYDNFGIEGEYAFVHEDINRSYGVQKSYIEKGLQYFTPDPYYSNNVFDYLMLIENAKEIHVIDSSFKQLIESVNVNAKKIFYHTYTRTHQFNTSTSKKDWIIL